jgi:CheY-like chemotaxis protein
MKTVIGLFKDYGSAEDTLGEFASLGLGPQQIGMLSPAGLGEVKPSTPMSLLDLPEIGQVAANGAMLRLLDAILSPRGYRVLTAQSGEEALGMLPASGADLVLLDVMMPGIDGYEVCRRIRRTPGLEFLPVVMITASGDQEKVRAIEAGADDFVTKPLNQGELLARVASLARVKRYQDTIQRQTDELARWNAELQLEAEEIVSLRSFRRSGRLDPKLRDGRRERGRWPRRSRLGRHVSTPPPPGGFRARPRRVAHDRPRAPGCRPSAAWCLAA